MRATFSTCPISSGALSAARPSAAASLRPSLASRAGLVRWLSGRSPGHAAAFENPRARPAQQIGELDSRLAAFERERGSQIVVLMVPTTQPEAIEQYSIRVAEAWKIGRKDVGDGLLFVIAKDDRRMRIAPAKRLEGAIPDLMARRILDQAVAPAFRQGNYTGGIQAGLDQILALIAGEALPTPQAQPADDALPWQDLLIFGVVALPIISGVLRGSSGVEPVYGSTSFQSLPSGYTVKRGDPGASVDTSVTAPYVTREYQICLKCHSDYGYADNNVHPLGNRPSLGRLGGTSPGTNNLTIYTNQAREFQAPIGHRGDGTGANSGAGSLYGTNNHRSWHPVLDSTGRSGAGANAFRLPWSNAVGTQTMYCSDCHGENTPEGTVVPAGGDNGTPWGPHGSNNNFLLKGLWNTNVGADNRGDSGPNANGLCFKCHNPSTYANRDGTGTTGFFNGDRGNLHAYHTDKIERIRCNWCHVAVPHGWKNKALLVNLNDVGPEAGRAGNEEYRIDASNQSYNQEPYYLNAKLKVRNFATSGNWNEANCGSNASALTFGPNGNNTNNGRDWMRDVCENPP